MLLVIDAGNTNTVFALYEGERLRAKWRAATWPAWDVEERALWLGRLLAGEGVAFEDLRGAVIGSVVGPLTAGLVALCRRLGLEPLLADELWHRRGYPIRVDEPAQVGIDRGANAVAAHARYPGAVLVVDFGTATKFDLVAADGGFEGGAICPGFLTGTAAMHRSLARVPAIAYGRPSGVVGRTTEAAALAGAFWGYVGLVEGLVRRIGAEYGKPLTVVATGGLAELLTPSIAAIDHVAPDLTLDGLALLYRAAAA